MKSHRDFAVYVRNGVEINALVAVSHPVTYPATETVEEGVLVQNPAVTVEHLTLVYLDPKAEAQRPTGDQLRNSIKIEFDVPPLTEGKVYGWKDVVSSDVQPVPVPVEAQGSGSERWGSGDWTKAGGDGLTYPGEGTAGATPSSPVVEGVDTKPEGVGPDGLTDEERGTQWGSNDHLKSIHGVKPAPEFEAEFVQSDPELQHAFNEDHAGKEHQAEEFSQVLRENADDLHTPAPSGDGRMESGHGPNPPEFKDTDPAQLDNPAPSSPKDEPIEGASN